RGSMIALMVAEFIAINPDAELYAIAQGNGTGQATAAAMNLTGTVTRDGIVYACVGGRRYTLPAPKGKKGKELTDELAALINADPDAPFTASSGAGSGDNGAGLKGSLGITARFTGECSVHDVRLNYHDGEATPEGIQVAIAYPKQKAANPDITRSVAGMGDRQYNYVVMPYKDDANLKIISDELLKRWGPAKMSDGVLWLAHTGTFGEVQAFGAKRNDFLATCTSIPKAPEPDYLWAAAVCATCAPSLGADPARPLQTLALPSRMAPAPADRLTREERNSLLWGGIATVSVAAGD
ncbi:phage tail sheath subtilisin-like domain-containing protein, partial [Escherichia coli]